MNYNFFLILSITVLNLTIDAASTRQLKPLTPSENYTHNSIINENKPDQYQLFWKILNDEIQFEIHCKTTGWVALGLSVNGGMPGSDIAIGWFRENKTYLIDCYAESKSTPIADLRQDLVLLDGAEINGYTIIKFKRKLITCDEKYDKEIKIGTQYLIFAWNDIDPLTGNNDWKYHEQNRLQKTLMLLTYKDETFDQEALLPSDTYTYSMRLDTRLPAKDTYYFCDLFILPEFKKPTHLIQFEMLVNSKNKQNVHHLLVYECEDDFIPEFLPLARECGTLSLPDNVRKRCTSRLILAWAIGGLYNYTFPKEAGYRFEQTTRSKYLLLEMHYANENLETEIIDDSGLKFYFTEKLRKYDLGLMTLGIDASFISLQIPPKSSNWSYTTICYPECTERYFPTNGIWAVSGLIHTHSAGRSVKTTLIRNGTAIRELFENPTYDYNFQFIIDIEPIKLYKGDVLITKCRYDTTNRNKFTFFGYGTYDEMCFDFLYYYPRIPNYERCSSGLPNNVLYNFYHSLMNEKLIPPMNFSEENYYGTQDEVINFFQTQVNVTTSLVKRFEDFFASNYNKSVNCGGSGNTFTKENVLHYTPLKSEIFETNTCADKPLNYSVLHKPLINLQIFILFLFIISI